MKGSEILNGYLMDTSMSIH